MPETRTHTEPRAGLGLVVAGGGTGGHLFPGIAVAQVFAAHEAVNRILFVNAGRPLEREVLGRMGFAQQAIAIEGLKGRGLWRQLRGGFKIPAAVARAGSILKAFKADLVLGVGGYSAGPVAVAAWLGGLPTAIHEQNRLPGVTNRLLARIARRIYISFDDSRDFFKADKVLLSGNPVRDEIRALGRGTLKSPGSGPLTVLVVGGSQGARAVNLSVVEALGSLENPAGLRFIHQTGSEDQAMLQKAYARAGIEAEVKAFFTDMAGCYARADLMICRAGATTVAEITVVGKAALFIPFPFAADDHQTRNAEFLAASDAAEIIHQKDLTGPLLAGKINEFQRNPERLTAMAEKAKSFGHPDAAEVIVNDLYELAKRS